MTPEQIKAAWEVIGKATPGPTGYGKRRDGTMWVSLGDPRGGPHVQADWEFGFDNLVAFAAARNPETGWPEALKEVQRLQNAIWPGLPKFVPTPEKPQQDFHEALIESFRTQHEQDKDEVERLRAELERRDVPVIVQRKHLSIHSSRVATCTECRGVILNGTEKFCPQCGRRLEWV